MTNITASMVNDLRKKTGAGMMDCKKALKETNGDIDAAVDFLRKKGIAKAEKKSGRTAADGLIAVASNGSCAAVVEINSETDFVARNEHFQAFCSQLADLVVNHDTAAAVEDVATLNNQDMAGKSVKDTLTDLVAKIGENMSIRRATRLDVTQGAVASYVHNAAAEGLGKIGVLVGLESPSDNTERLNAVGRQIAMHIAATRPQSLAIEDLDQTLVARERDVLVEQARASGKPEEIIEKMVDGRLRKYYEEVVLLEQVFVVDGERRVKQVIEDLAKELGQPVKMTAFTRMELGEGIAKEESNLADEVAATLGQ